MKLDKRHIIKLFYSNKTTKAELNNLFYWFNSDKGYNELENELKEDWDNFELSEELALDSKKIFKNIAKRTIRKKSSGRIRFIKNFWFYAAVLIFLVGINYYFFYFKSGFQHGKINNYYATTVITEEGQRSKVILPDSSVVWLNSSTTLSYYEDALNKERRVKLIGEAFFHVSRNENKPFFVQNNQIIVKVLGTEFDVEAYPENKKVNIALESGSILLQHEKNKSFNYKLIPGEIANFDLSKNKLNVAKIDVKKFSSWKNGRLIFQNDPMKLVIEKLERWYNIDVVVKDDEVYNSIFTGTITNEGYEQIFRLISYTCSVNCIIENKTKFDVKSKIIMTKKEQINQIK